MASGEILTERASSQPNTKIDNKILANSWMVRPCEAYKDEHTECTSMKGKFHQYFIHGETLDCSQWVKDYENCMEFRMTKEQAPLAAVIKSEQVRRFQRMAPFFLNDVWKHRKTPPGDWNKPLPEKMQKEYQDTYLDHKAREYRSTNT